jgi:hypothetical protein
MRAWAPFTFALYQAVLLSACVTISRSSATSTGTVGDGFQAELYQACGRHVVYPINAKCIRLMDSVGPLLQHRSDLVMAIWRSCPQESPCSRIASKEPACAASSDAAHPQLLGGDNQACLKAEEADYSCAALLNDLVYTQMVKQQPKPAAADFECERAKTALANFDREIERMSVRIQWYRSFAVQGF